ncbi:MAG: hypothetical protein HC918_05745 [Oscillatoriales cyanobacterium SM2_1_8]|nr:hypothetical protein [Oscillatoriales cyanobacterium SM2_1_8]
MGLVAPGLQPPIAPFPNHGGPIAKVDRSTVLVIQQPTALNPIQEKPEVAGQVPLPHGDCPQRRLQQCFDRRLTGFGLAKTQLFVKLRRAGKPAIARHLLDVLLQLRQQTHGCSGGRPWISAYPPLTLVFPSPVPLRLNGKNAADP